MSRIVVDNDRVLASGKQIASTAVLGEIKQKVYELMDQVDEGSVMVVTVEMWTKEYLDDTLEAELEIEKEISDGGSNIEKDAVDDDKLERDSDEDGTTEDGEDCGADDSAGEDGELVSLDDSAGDPFDDVEEKVTPNKKSGKKK